MPVGQAPIKEFGLEFCQQYFSSWLLATRLWAYGLTFFIYYCELFIN